MSKRPHTKRKLAFQNPMGFPFASPTSSPKTNFPSVARNFELSIDAKYSHSTRTKKHRTHNKNVNPNCSCICDCVSEGASFKKLRHVCVPTDKNDTKTASGTPKIARSIIPASSRIQNPPKRISGREMAIEFRSAALLDPKSSSRLTPILSRHGILGTLLPMGV